MPRFSLPTLPHRREASLNLGQLERYVLDVIWTLGDADASIVNDAIASVRPTTLSTIQSTLERLHRKRLLHRRKIGRAYHYTASVSREDLIGDLVADIVRGLSPSASQPGLCGFIDSTGRVEEATLQRLEAWIARHRQRSADSD